VSDIYSRQDMFLTTSGAMVRSKDSELAPRFESWLVV